MEAVDNKRAGSGDVRGRMAAASSEAGFMLVEVLTSALMVVIISIGVFGALQSMTQASGQERTRITAHGLAQADQARMRNFHVGDLSNYSESRLVEDGGTTFNVESDASFVSDDTGTASCEESTASADYIRVTSTVSWPTMGSRPPVVLQSTIAPPNGSISADAGALAVRVENGAGEGLAGVGLSGTGAGAFSGQTNENGCAIFGNLPAGNYDLLATASGLVDRDGEQPTAKPASVIPFATNVIVLQYDQPGSVELDFTTFIDGALQPSSADSVVVFNTGMSVSKAYGTVGSPQSSMTISPLFPFSSSYAIYAGTCPNNNPNPRAKEPPPASQASVVVPAGGAVSGTIQLPALDLEVRDGSASGAAGNPVEGATVVIEDRRCRDEAGNRISRTYTTDAEGGLPDPGLPRGRYNVCVHDGSHREQINNLNVRDLDQAYELDLYTGDFWRNGSC